MEKLAFAFYYLKLQTSVLLGIYKTGNPLGIKYRWEHWKWSETTHQKERLAGKRKASGEKSKVVNSSAE